MEQQRETGTVGAPEGRRLETLERLLQIDMPDVDAALDQATQVLAEVLCADKVDVMLFDRSSSSLVARGTSDTEMGRRQHALGLHRLPVANGGRNVEVYQTHRSFIDGHVERDEQELIGIREALGVRSSIIAYLDVPGVGNGVLLASSARNEYFTEGDLRFLEAVGRWVGLVAHRAALVQRTAQEATEQGRRRAAEELMTVLAHDLRNLMAPLSGRLQLLRRRAAYEDRAALAEHAVEATTALERMRRFVDEILDVERLERGIFSLRLEPVDLAALAREVAHTFGGQGVALRVETTSATSEPGAAIVPADIERLRQALENVVSNAVRHSPDGGTVTLTLDVELRGQGPYLLLAIHDQGPGLPADLADHLFHKFAAGAGSSGLGLGLYLASRIVAAHGGELTATSPPGEGAKFRFALPKHPPEHQPIVRVAEPPG